MAKSKDKIVKDIFKKHDPIKATDYVEREKISMKEDIEDLRQTDLEGGEDYFIEKRRSEDAVENRRREDFVDLLSANKSPLGYRQLLVEYANLSVGYAQLDPSWILEFFETSPHTGTLNIGKKSLAPQYGFIGMLISPKGEKFIRAVNISLIPEVDMNAVNVVIIQAENTIDNSTGRLFNQPKKEENKLIIV